ncbi:hypothetical protein [Comamonas sp.]|uniref:hypothetical protein n=1 Tax=Comamonas sp. TaxID=34028 RepID=UPI00259025E3|nr:hypothetical protein [Comamonas sp.]
MTADMRNAIYHQMDFGQLALQKLGQLDPNFRLYLAGIKPEPPKEWTHMEVVGAVFREPKSGPNKGTLSMMVPGTRKSVKLSRSELTEYRANQKADSQTNESK